MLIASLMPAGKPLEMIEESANALWAIADSTNTAYKEAVAEGGAVALLMNVLNNCASKRTAGESASNGLIGSARACECSTRRQGLQQPHRPSTSPASVCKCSPRRSPPHRRFLGRAGIACGQM